jgi:hypothetical protein
LFNGAVPVLLMAAFLRPTVADDIAPASRAFARYLAGATHGPPWSPETIEIEAALPKLQKHGRLRAIRRTTPEGTVDFEVLEIDGDRIVRQQVMERYLNAQITAAGMSPASLAITPENYQFRYQGPVQSAEGVAYAFQIKPWKKRAGMISGELWLDGETGTAVRQSGRLVKPPSLFVKSAGFTRETVLRGGVAQKLLTHLSVETRLVGQADLTVTESPLR